MTPSNPSRVWPAISGIATVIAVIVSLPVVAGYAIVTGRYDSEHVNCENRNEPWDLDLFSLGVLALFAAIALFATLGIARLARVDRRRSLIVTSVILVPAFVLVWFLLRAADHDAVVWRCGD